MSHRVYIGIGSNIGDRAGFISKATEEIKKLAPATFREMSSVYETKPYGVKEQENFYNLVIGIDYEGAPLDLFMELKNIEKKTGRGERARWHEREIDLDILLFGEIVIKTDELEIPHAELVKRDFVILPLLEINSNIIIPGTGRMLREIVIPEEDRCVIKKLNLKF